MVPYLRASTITRGVVLHHVNVRRRRACVRVVECVYSSVTTANTCLLATCLASCGLVPFKEDRLAPVCLIAVTSRTSCCADGDASVLTAGTSPGDLDPYRWQSSQGSRGGHRRRFASRHQGHSPRSTYPDLELSDVPLRLAA